MEIDYTWNITNKKILINEEVDIDQLGWKHGDCFRLVNVDGRAMLIKLDRLEKFVRGYN